MLSKLPFVLKALKFLGLNNMEAQVGVNINANVRAGGSGNVVSDPPPPLASAIETEITANQVYLAYIARTLDKTADDVHDLQTQLGQVHLRLDDVDQRLDAAKQRADIVTRRVNYLLLTGALLTAGMVTIIVKLFVG